MRRYVGITGLYQVHRYYADPSGHAVLGLGLRLLACWECEFEFRRGHGCRQVVVPATVRSLVLKSPAECGVSKSCFSKPQQ